MPTGFQKASQIWKLSNVEGSFVEPMRCEKIVQFCSMIETQKNNEQTVFAKRKHAQQVSALTSPLKNFYITFLFQLGIRLLKYRLINDKMKTYLLEGFIEF